MQSQKLSPTPPQDLAREGGRGTNSLTRLIYMLYSRLRGSGASMRMRCLSSPSLTYLEPRTIGTQNPHFQGPCWTSLEDTFTSHCLHLAGDEFLQPPSQASPGNMKPTSHLIAWKTKSQTKSSNFGTQNPHFQSPCWTSLWATFTSQCLHLAGD